MLPLGELLPAVLARYGVGREEFFAVARAVLTQKDLARLERFWEPHPDGDNTMSREFGESYGGFFHEKLNHALEDAQGGESTGAKLMAAILEPLVKMAWAVSSEEASDSGESSTVAEFFTQLPVLERAVRGVSEYTEPARKVAVECLANELAQLATVKQVDDEAWEVVVPHREHSPAEWEVKTAAIVLLAWLESGKWGHWQGSYTGSQDGYTTHRVACWGNKKKRAEWLSKRVSELEGKLALAEAKLKGQPA